MVNFLSHSEPDEIINVSLASASCLMHNTSLAFKTNSAKRRAARQLAFAEEEINTKIHNSVFKKPSYLHARVLLASKLTTITSESQLGFYSELQKCIKTSRLMRTGCLAAASGEMCPAAGLVKPRCLTLHRCTF